MRIRLTVKEGITRGALRTAVALGFAVAASAGHTTAATPQAPSPATTLPTPLEHYEEFDNAAAARALLPRIALRLDPATLQRVMAMVGPDPEANPP